MTCLAYLARAWVAPPEKGWALALSTIRDLNLNYRLRRQSNATTRPPVVALSAYSAHHEPRVVQVDTR